MMVLVGHDGFQKEDSLDSLGFYKKQKTVVKQKEGFKEIFV